MLSGISLAGSISTILAAGALVLAAYAGLWACKRIIGLFRNEAGIHDSGFDEVTGLERGNYYD